VTPSPSAAEARPTSTTLTRVEARRAWLRLDVRFLPLAVTVLLFVLMFGAGSLAFDSFFSLQVFLNLFVDNAFLIITAIGMTFVILSGGIDLSVGSLIALTTMVSASLVEHHGVPPLVVIALVLLMGAAFGLVQGFLIHYFDIQPFIVTLAGLFLARGLCYLISIDSIAITNPFFTDVSALRLPLPFGTSISVNVIIALVVLVVAVYLAHYTRFGRTVYAIGGNEQSALLMGLPVASTKILVYTFSGFCSALAGVAFTFYMLSGYALHAQGMEMDAIAAAVVGGTLLTGGSGYLVGTLFGVLVTGTIQTLIMFQGELSSWWTKIVIGLLLFVFCLLQRAFERGSKRRRGAMPAERVQPDRAGATEPSPARAGS
jgi:simple sugar transport system permease protein